MADAVGYKGDTPRYELKYRVTEEQVQAIREYIKDVCIVDPYVDQTLRGGWVMNLYFDTSKLHIYSKTRDKAPRRFKLRARYYLSRSRPEDSIFLEIKHRDNDFIWKVHKPVRIRDWPGPLEDRSADIGRIERVDILNSFEAIVHYMDARPFIHINYFRESYVSVIDDNVRITFDTKLSCQLAEGSYGLLSKDSMPFFDDPESTRNTNSMVVLEIKIVPPIPAWLSSMVRQLNLMQDSFSKYCFAVESNMLYHETLRNFGAPF
jgi:hypothetical protein